MLKVGIFWLLSLFCLYSQTNEIIDIVNQIDDLEKITLYIRFAESNKDVHPAKMLKFAKDAYFLSKKINDVGIKKKAVLLIAEANEINFNYSKSIIYYLEYLKLINNIEDQRQIYNKLGFLNDILGKYNVAKEYYLKAFKISYELNNKKFLAEDYFNLGIIDDTEGKYVGALENYNKALNLFRELNYKKNIVISSLAISQVQRIRFDLDSAFSSLNYAHQICSELNDDTLLAKTNYYFGIYFFKIKDFNKSLENLKKSLKINEELNYQKSIANSAGYMGLVSAELGQLDKALFYHQKALKIREKINDDAGKANSNTNLGDVYFNYKKYNEALKYYNKAYDFRKKTTNKYGIAECERNIGRIYHKLGHNSLAHTYILSSIKYANEEHLDELKAKNYLTLSEIYEGLNNLPKALEYYKQYSVLDKDLSNKQNDKQLKNLEYKYDAEKNKKIINEFKQKETLQKYELIVKQNIIFILLSLILFIVLITAILYYRFNIMNKNKVILEEKNKQIILQKEQLEELINTKDKFFSIISHDLKNPFQALIGLSELIVRNYDNMSDEDKKIFITQINDTSKLSYSLLENLLQWSRTQMNLIEPNIKQINLLKTLNDTFSLVNANAGNKEIKINIEIDPDIELKSDPNILNTIIRNLVSNAIKFTPKKGIVNISAKTVEQKIRIDVEDNGVGMSKEKVNNLFKVDVQQSTYGTEKERGTGLGLLLCKDLVKMLGGIIEVESKIGYGTKFTLLLNNELNP